MYTPFSARTGWQAALAGALLLLAAGGHAGDRLITAATAWGGKVTLNQPLPTPVEVDGVKVESVFFSGDEALVIIWNKGTHSVDVALGLALFDGKGRLLATGRDVSGLRLGGNGVRPGRQATFRFAFDDFVGNVGNARTFQLALALSMRKPGSRPATTD